MISTLFPLRSLKTRVALFTLGIFVLSLLALSFYISKTLRTDMQKQLGEQQFSTVSLVAENINDALVDRLTALQMIAAEISPKLLENPTAVQAFLAQHPIFLQQFDGGIFVARSDGIATAEFPFVVGSPGAESSSREYVIRTLKEGRSTISMPILDKETKDSGIAFTSPVRDKHGKTLGVVVGVTRLDHAVSFDKIAGNRYGKTGGYLLLVPQYRLAVTASGKKNFVTNALPATGISPPLDRFIQGYEGSDVFVNPAGVEVLASVKSIPAAGWSVAAMLPTEEAFAPVHNIQRSTLLAAFLLTLLAGGLTWWMLRREFASLPATTKMLATLLRSNQPPSPLPITRRDEIGDLIDGFNLLLEASVQREAALRKSKSSPRTLPTEIPDLVWLKDKDGVFLSCNQRFERFFGALEKDIVGKTDYDFVDKDQADFFRQNDLKAIEKSEPSVNEEHVRFADDGHREVLETTKIPLFDSSHRLIGVLGIGRPSSTVGTRERRFLKGSSTSHGGFRAFFENQEQ